MLYALLLEIYLYAFFLTFADGGQAVHGIASEPADALMCYSLRIKNNHNAKSKYSSGFSRLGIDFFNWEQYN